MKPIYSYKNKFLLLLAGGLLFLLICYNLAFKNTFSEIKTHKSYVFQLASIEGAPNELKYLENRSKELESYFNSIFQFEDNIEVLLLDKATTLIASSNLKVVELPKNESYSNDGYLIKLQHIVIQGAFIDLLRFLHSMELDHSTGNISSVDFYSQKNMKSGHINLNMKIYFQTIIQDKK